MKQNHVTLQECHKILLKIAKEFHNICEAHNIPYYMLGGTQLGAVRHRGMIPWDDDMDFGVPREYFEQLKHILSTELQPSYNVISIDTTTQYYGGFIKIEDSNTVVETLKDSSFPLGLNIDIFPLDRTNGNVGLFSRNNLILLLYKIENYRFGKTRGEGFLKWFISKMLKVCLPLLDRKTIYNIIDRHLLVGKGEYIANYYGAWGYKEIVKADYFGVPTLYDFEDKKFYGVQYPDKYLAHLYGDYMQLPPEEKRHTHIKNAYYK